MTNTSAPSMSRNVLWNVAEVVAVAAALFLTYRVVLQQLGVEALGLWSLVGAVIALSRFADVGISAGLPSRMATAQADGPTVRQWVTTALALNMVTYGVLALLIWVFGSYGLAQTDLPELSSATSLLGYCVIAFALAGIAGTMGFALIGLRRSDLKSYLVIAGSIIQLIAALLLIPHLGLIGLAAAQIIQSSLYAFVGFIVLLRFTRDKARPAPVLSIHLPAAKDLFLFGLKIQGLNISGFLYEPLTRFMIAYVGGLHLLGLYELASRIVAQARQLAVVPASNLLAVFAARAKTQRLRADYDRAFLITTIAGVGLMCTVVASAPIVSLLWLGGLDWQFLGITLALALGWAVNISAIPAYYLGIAQDRLKWNMIGALALAFASPALVYLTSLISPSLIGLGAAMALSIGAVITHRTASPLTHRSGSPRRLLVQARLLFENLTDYTRHALSNRSHVRPNDRFVL